MSKYIAGLQHIGLPVTDLEKTIDFYEKLGFSVVGREQLPSGGEPVAFLALRGLVIEAYQQGPVAKKTGAWAHVAFDVDDIASVWTEVQAMGITPEETEIQFLPFWEKGVRYFNIKGPNEEIIEFNQRL